MKSSYKMCEIFYLLQLKDFMHISSDDNWNVNTVNFIWEKSRKGVFHTTEVLSCFCVTKGFQFGHTCLYFFLSKIKSRYQLQTISILKFINQPFWQGNVTQVFNTTAFFTAQLSCLKRSMHLGNVFLGFFLCFNEDFLV